METASTSALANLPSALSTGTSITQKNSSDDQKSQFLKLLVAQLKGQNPLDPMDGMQFVSQLAQFTSVEELINIRTLLEANSKAAAATNTGTATNTEATNPFQGA
jgi:flagellar basal-body rod modification protein FlgD